MISNEQDKAATTTATTKEHIYTSIYVCKLKERHTNNATSLHTTSTTKKAAFDEKSKASCQQILTHNGVQVPAKTQIHNMKKKKWVDGML